MAVVEETRATPVAAPPIADPAPLGLAAFALTTFMLSGHNANFIPDLMWVGLALFYGGLTQLLAGMWEFRNNNTFGSTAFSTYGGFWLGLGAFVILAEATKLGGTLTGKNDVANGLAWFLLAFAIFNFYMLLWSTRVNLAVVGVFLTLQVTEILLAIGFWTAAHRGVAPTGAEVGWIRAGGWAGIVTAAVAWYASAALVLAAMNNGRAILPVGKSLWNEDGFSFGQRRRLRQAHAAR
ncbi:MAG TPA: acetate uptake transporter [Gaiellaceae bacterium]|jgi:succinate-acetate transporter protein|nr:acetate uptake transporter [Gaiellaceae bacterium]